MNKRALLGLALVALPARAQFGRRRSRQSEEKAPQRPRIEPLEVSLHELYEDLKINGAQEPLWQKYADQVRSLAADVARQKNQAVAPGGALARLDRTIDVARDRLTALEEIQRAAKFLYASLTAEQQALCDPRLANIPAAIALGQP